MRITRGFFILLLICHMSIFYPQTKVKKTWADVQQMIHDRLQKIEEIKQSVVLKRVSIT